MWRGGPYVIRGEAWVQPGKGIVAIDSAPTIFSCEFKNNKSYPVFVPADGVRKVLYNSFIQNDTNAILVDSGDVSHDALWQAQGVPFHLLGNIYVSGKDGSDGVTTLKLDRNDSLVFLDSARFENGELGIVYHLDRWIGGGWKEKENLSKSLTHSRIPYVHSGSIATWSERC